MDVERARSLIHALQEWPQTLVALLQHPALGPLLRPGLADLDAALTACPKDADETDTEANAA